MAGMTEGDDLSNWYSIWGEYDCLHETRFVLSEFVISSVADLLLLKIYGVEAMSRVSILEGHVGAL